MVPPPPGAVRCRGGQTTVLPHYVWNNDPMTDASLIGHSLLTIPTWKTILEIFFPEQFLPMKMSLQSTSPTKKWNILGENCTGGNGPGRVVQDELCKGNCPETVVSSNNQIAQ